MIVIIGAGLAGLAVAQKLTEANQKDFIIVEAQDYIGGRIKTTHSEDGTRIDLGAQWLHGEKENPIYEWLRSKNFIDGPEEEEVEFEGLFVTQRGERLPVNVVATVLESCIETKKFFYKFSSLLFDAMPVERSKPASLIRGYLAMDATGHTFGSVLMDSEHEVVMAIERWFELYEAIDNSCQSFDDLSMRAYRDWNDYDGGKMVRLRGGWQSVVDDMIQSIGREKILLDRAVERIDYSQELAKVTLANGEMINCDHVIVTIPLGALKRLLKRDFIKPYFNKKHEAIIDRLGFGPTVKIFLQFEQPFLQEEKGIKMVWIDKEDENLQVGLPSWTKDMTGFDIVSGAPNLLLVWVGRAGALEAERCSDSEVGEICIKVLRTFLPNKGIPKLISVTKSNWSTNQHVGGAYSYPSIQGDRDRTKRLWEPICVPNQTMAGPKMIPRILFAGEATAGEMYATAHGAIVSGWREASRLLKLLTPST